MKTCVRFRDRISVQGVVGAIVILVLAGTTALAEKKLYLANYYAGINSMNLDGTEREQIASTGFNWRSVCFDPVETKIYWACENGSVSLIQKANLDGTSVEDVLVSDDYYKPRDIVLDSSGRKLYWADMGLYGSHAGIYRCDLDGSAVEYLISEENVSYIDLDTVSGKLYWTSFGNNWICRAEMDGSSQETLISGGNHPRGIAIDVVGGMMYWTEGSGSPRIQRADLDGSNAEVLVNTGDTAMRTLGDLVLDVEEGKMYWADENPWVSCANIDGSNPHSITSDSVCYAGDIALIPEPATLSLLTVGAMALIRRRRK